ncbi:uncharacterized protein K452DRAFT_236585 [Aplosporella prunicola CBS 121167]|uniref:RTA1 like protein n=1 Tax=Aplosporella prunicola CBS 121167 TaxID=1176127 RepID=A0A6A6B0T0_9PEZI|nr:uncharacterized protein K452DRAFT_236585 [Aplosporella prunicola CBS 121167]KAF2137033.1 hypothetical protein K452DRAFT_236585 [Aplosporella prunicola CBS 121167]
MIRIPACHPPIEGFGTSYGYVPSKSAGIAYLVLFGLSMFAHCFQTVMTRSWWTLVFAVGALTEVIGWGGRYWSSECPYSGDAFLMQITTLIIAPTFFTAGIYVILGRLINAMGRDSSPISEKMYLIIFCTCDVVSLVVQAVGGGMASVASQATPPEDTKPGTNIMVAGIVFQMASITLFCFFFGLFLWRVRHRSLSGRVKTLVAATTLSIVVIYIRSIYRTIELSQGWSGYLITHEEFFIALDGAMMVIAVAAFNFVHPATFLPVPTRDLGSYEVAESEAKP